MKKPVVFVLVAALALVLSLAHSSESFAECAHSERVAGTCSSVSSESDGESVTIERSESSTGDPGSEGTSGSSAYGQDSDWWSPPPIRTEAELGSSECEITVVGLCRGQAPPKATTDTSAATPPAPPRFASELKNFRPHKPGIRTAPNGWSLPALPANIYAQASRHRVKGKLLGWPVEVRFTPVAYHWSYGDGSRASLSQPGSSGSPQFSSTPTSHVFLRPGRYTVALQVDYRAEFRFEGGSFQRVSGRVSATASPVTIQVLTVSPLLVAR